MRAWWEALTMLERIFAAVAIPATLLLLIQLVMTLMGLGGHDGDLDGEGPEGDFPDLDGDGIPDGIDLDGDGVPTSAWMPTPTWTGTGRPTMPPPACGSSPSGGWWPSWR